MQKNCQHRLDVKVKVVSHVRQTNRKKHVDNLCAVADILYTAAKPHIALSREERNNTLCLGTNDNAKIGLETDVSTCVSSASSLLSSSSNSSRSSSSSSSAALASPPGLIGGVGFGGEAEERAGAERPSAVLIGLLPLLPTSLNNFSDDGA